MNKGSAESALRANSAKITAPRGLFFTKLVHLFVEVREEAVILDSVTLSDASTSGESFLLRKLHSYYLLCSKESSQIVIRAPRVQKQWEILPFVYPFNTSNEVLQTMGDFYISDFYAWIFGALRAVGASAIFMPAISLNTHFSVPVDVKSSPKDLFEVSVDDDSARKEVAVRSFSPQTYRRNEVRLTIFQFDKVQNLLRTDS